MKIGYAKALNLSVDQKFVKDKSEEIAAMKRTIQEMEKPMQKLREDLQRVGQLRKEAGNGYVGTISIVADRSTDESSC